MQIDKKDNCNIEEGIDKEMPLRIDEDIKCTEEKGFQYAQEFFNSFIDSYVSAYYVNLNNSSCIVFRREKSLEAKNGDIINYFTSAKAYILSSIHEDDRAPLIKASDPEYIKSRLKKEKRFSFYGRDISGDNIRWILFEVIRGADSEHTAIALTDVTISKNTDDEIKNNLKNALFEAENQRKLLKKALVDYEKADHDRKTDFLTGLNNRQALFLLINDVISGDEPPIQAMFMLDIDFFKQLNDRYGHSYGDNCLKKIGEALKAYGKKNHIVFFRYGGEEILGVDFAAESDKALVAEEILFTVNGLKITHMDSPNGYVSASIGYTTDNSRYEKMINKADVALYAAKGNGRNQVVCYEKIKSGKLENKTGIMPTVVTDKSEFAYQALSRATNSGWWDIYYDNRNKIRNVKWSDDFRRLLGYRDNIDFPDSMSSIKNIMCPEDWKLSREKMLDVIKDDTGKAYYMQEYQLSTKEKGKRWFKAIGTALRRENGTVQRFFGVFYDITEDIERQEEYEREKQTLKDSLLRLELIQKALGAGYWELKIDKSGTPIGIIHSDSFRKMLGYESKEDYPDDVNIIDKTIHPDEVEYRKNAFNSALIDKEHNRIYEMDYRMKCKSGEYHWFRSVGGFLRDEDGDAREYVGIIYNNDEIHESKFIDPLTKGYNREGFIRESEKILASNKISDYAVIYTNICDFKAVNEIYGLNGGDSLIKLEYRLLCKSKFEPCVVARIDCDHIAALLRKDKLDYALLDKCGEWRWKYNDISSHIFCNIGIYLIEEGEELNVAFMLDMAKLAIENIIDSHVKPYSVYEVWMSENYFNQAELLSEYMRGIENEEFQVYYQPVFDAFTEEPVSAEALVRWIHPKKGMIRPSNFISALEENGQIAKLDRYVLNHVYEKMLIEYKNTGDIVPISVNLSRMDFYDKIFMNFVRDLLEKNDFPNNKLRFEITETSMARLFDNEFKFINEFKSKGAGIYLDDFGSGYSSLAFLDKLDFDVLKIDSSLVSEIEKSEKSMIITKHTIELCHSLGIKIVAEGVKNTNQLEMLKSCGCDYIQGYYFSKPMPEDEFYEFIKNKRKNRKN